MKPRVLLDVDGVLADFVGGYLALLKHHTGMIYTRDDVTEFDIGAALGLTAEQSSRMKQAIGAAPGFARTLDVYPGARQGVIELQRVADVYIVTSPWNSNPTWTHDREWWLREHFGIEHTRVVHTSAKHLVTGDVLVDDKVETVRAWDDAHPLGAGVVWDTPHNRSEKAPWLRTSSWSVLVEAVAGCQC